MVTKFIKYLLVIVVAIALFGAIGVNVEGASTIAKWMKSNHIIFDSWGVILYFLIFIFWSNICQFYVKKRNYSDKQLQALIDKRVVFVLGLVAFDLAFVQGFLSELIFWGFK